MVLTFTEAGNILGRLDLSTLNGEARERVEDEIGRLASAQWFDGLDFYASLVNDGAFLDHFPQRTLVVLDQHNAVVLEKQVAAAASA